jgi:hypothetical protein
LTDLSQKRCDIGMCPRTNPLWVKALAEGGAGALKRPVLAGRRVDGRVREWLGPKSRCAGCEPATLDDRDVPECPPGPALSLGAVGVDEELAVDRVADVALERADRVLLGLALGQLALEVRAALGVALADLADGGQLQGVVQPSVAPWETRWTIRPPEDRSTGAVLL